MKLDFILPIKYAVKIEYIVRVFTIQFFSMKSHEVWIFFSEMLIDKAIVFL